MCSVLTMPAAPPLALPASAAGGAATAGAAAAAAGSSSAAGAGCTVAFVALVAFSAGASGSGGLLARGGRAGITPPPAGFGIKRSRSARYVWRYPNLLSGA